METALRSGPSLGYTGCMRFVFALAIVACEPEDLIVYEMEQALYDSQTAVALQLVGTELISHAFDETDTGTTSSTYRHDGGSCCPCTDRAGEAPPYILTLDYDEGGCVPDSGLIPSSLAGHAIVEFDGTTAEVTFDGLEVGIDNLITGSLSGTPSPDLTQIDVVASMEASGYAADLTATTLIDPDVRIEIDGEAVVTDARPLTLAGLQIPWERIAPPCPTPEAGHATLEAESTVDVDFADPGAGFVTVSRKKRVSESVEYCGYRTSLF